MSDCIFCKIADHEIPSNAAYEDDLCYGFYDLEPQAPVHVLLVPQKHLSSLDDAKPEDQELLGHMMLTVSKIAADLGLEDGYRVVINTGEDGGQSVKHLHMHILGKRKMSWPPG